MTVQELIDLLANVEDKGLTVFATVGTDCKKITSVETYEDAIDLWARG